MKQKQQITCETCFRIACKKCTWVATTQEVEAIQKGKMTACPLCGWKPGTPVL